LRVQILQLFPQRFFPPVLIFCLTLAHSQRGKRSKGTKIKIPFSNRPFTSQRKLLPQYTQANEIKRKAGLNNSSRLYNRRKTHQWRGPAHVQDRQGSWWKDKQHREELRLLNPCRARLAGSATQQGRSFLWRAPRDLWRPADSPGNTYGHRAQRWQRLRIPQHETTLPVLRKHSRPVISPSRDPTNSSCFPNL